MYLAGGGWAPYFTYSESFSPEYGSNPVSGEDYDPITGKQYEAGVRYQPPSAGISAAVAVFDIRKENQLIQNPNNPGNSNDQIQAGETKSQGIELSLLAGPDQQPAGDGQLHAPGGETGRGRRE